MSGLWGIVLRTANPIATKEPAAAMAVGFAPGRKSATFWLFRTASTASVPTTNVVLSLVAASAFGCEAVEKTDDLWDSVWRISSAFSFFLSLFVHIRTLRRGRCVREGNSIHLADAVVISSSDDPPVWRRCESGNEVRVSFAGHWSRFARRIIAEHAAIG